MTDQQENTEVDGQGARVNFETEEVEGQTAGYRGRKANAPKEVEGQGLSHGDKSGA